jgi:hypothetical protein
LDRAKICDLKIFRFPYRQNVLPNAFAALILGIASENPGNDVLKSGNHVFLADTTIVVKVAATSWCDISLS